MDEDQFILRLPEPLAEKMRLGLSSKAKRDAAGATEKFAVRFIKGRTAVFSLDGDEYPAFLMDLPCIVETHKTADKRTFFKSGDVHQVLVVRMPGEPAPETHELPHGITNSARDAAKRFHIPENIFSPDQVESVEKQMKFVVDNKVQFVRKKEPEPPQKTASQATLPPDDEDITIEEEAEAVVPASTASASAPAKDADAGTPASKQVTPASSPPAAATPAGTDAMEIVPPARGTPVPATPDVSTPAPATPAPAAPSPSPAPEDTAGTPATAASPALPDGSPAPVATPVADTPAADTPMEEAPTGAEDEDDEMDDFAAMLADEMIENEPEKEAEEARKRIERTTMDAKIEDMRTKIQTQEQQADKAPNPILKARIMTKAEELRKQLTDLEKARAALD